MYYIYISPDGSNQHLSYDPANKQVSGAMNMAWPWIIRNIHQNSHKQPKENIYDLENKVKDLNNEVRSLNDMLSMEHAEQKKLKDIISDSWLPKKSQLVQSNQPHNLWLAHHCYQWYPYHQELPQAWQITLPAHLTPSQDQVKWCTERHQMTSGLTTQYGMGTTWTTYKTSPNGDGKGEL